MLFWAPPFKKVVKILECVQKSSPKLVKGLEGISYEERLMAQDFSSLERRQLRGNLIALLFYSILFVLLPTSFFPYQYMLRKSLMTFLPSPAPAEGIAWAVMSHPKHCLSRCGKEACTF